MYQYRMTVNGTTGPVLAALPGAQWAHAAEVVEVRGGLALLERRLVTDRDIIPLLTDPTGCITIGDRVACPWEVIAQVEER